MLGPAHGVVRLNVVHQQELVDADLNPSAEHLDVHCEPDVIGHRRGEDVSHGVQAAGLLQFAVVPAAYVRIVDLGLIPLLRPTRLLERSVEEDARNWPSAPS